MPRKSDEEKRALKREYEGKRYLKKRQEILQKQRAYYYQTHDTDGPRTKLTREEILERHRLREIERRRKAGIKPRSKMPDEERKRRKSEYNKSKYKENPKKFREKSEKWRRDNPEKAKEVARNSQAKRLSDPEIRKTINDRNVATHNENRQKIYRHYGGKCHCECGCTEDNDLFLTVAHINQDGAEDRRKYPGTKQWYAYLVRQNFKHDKKLQLECMNCNFGKSRNHNRCPKTKI